MSLFYRSSSLVQVEHQSISTNIQQHLYNNYTMINELLEAMPLRYNKFNRQWKQHLYIKGQFTPSKNVRYVC